MTVYALMLGSHFESVEMGHDSPCWIWIRGTSKGRPICRVNGKNRNAQRVLWEHEKDESLKNGVVLMRQCEQSLCVNPHHFRKSLRELGLRRFTSPEERRVWNLRKYGITPTEYDAMLESQGGACAVCKQDDRDRLGRRLHVDHDHISGRVRGLLCTRCNNAIGHARENPGRLRALADYLDRGA